MGVHEGSGQLNKSIKDLMHRWSDVRSNWDDARAREFEERFLTHVAVEVRNASGAMNNMAVLLHQIRHDCE